MQSSGSVGILGRDERFEAQLHQQHHHLLLPHRRTRAHDPQPYSASSLITNSYSQPNPPPYGQPYQQHHHQHRGPVPQSPPSPPGEDTIKPSLPSISSLLGMADSEQQSATQSAQVQQTQGPAPQSGAASTHAGEHQPATFVQNYAQPNASRMALPPTPPLGSDHVLDGNRSPPAVTSQSANSASPYYLGQAMNNLEPHQQRQGLPPDPMAKRPSVPPQGSVSPYITSPYSTSPYPPATASTSPYYATEPQALPSAGLYAQRPLPSNFPPSINVSIPAGTTAANPWQHHHYISASSQPAFPQTQDRYICPTCNKAFSRPSSLRIHSHSHTGEKPFRCSHAGCGKAFSVRSNMKRHERGCHAIAAGSVPTST